jgi:hypothetical protein
VVDPDHAIAQCVAKLGGQRVELDWPTRLIVDDLHLQRFIRKRHGPRRYGQHADLIRYPSRMRGRAGNIRHVDLKVRSLLTNIDHEFGAFVVPKLCPVTCKSARCQLTRPVHQFCH